MVTPSAPPLRANTGLSVLSREGLASKASKQLAILTLFAKVGSAETVANILSATKKTDFILIGKKK